MYTQPLHTISKFKQISKAFILGIVLSLCGSSFVAFNVGYKSIEMTDLNGKVLQRITLGNTETSKDVSLVQYPAAMYFIKLVGANKMSVHKVIKH